MKKHTTTFKFTGKASLPKNALALIYDLEGFSRFFNQPDVQDYVPSFLNYVSEAIAVCLFGGAPYWTKEDKWQSMPLRVVHEKFTGDGALYVILPPTGQSDFSSGDLGFLCNRFWMLKTHFKTVVKKSLEHVPVVELPQRIRFGLSRGSVYQLNRSKATSPEYIGFCINLASRLQSYCRDLGFIASARLMIPDKLLKKNGYRKAVASQLKGFPDELVIVDDSEYTVLPEDIRDSLFREPE